MSSDLFAPLPEPTADPFGTAPSSRTLGLVALIVAAVVVLAASIGVAIAGYPLGEAAGHAFASTPVGQSVDPAWMSDLQGWVAVLEVAFWLGTLGGMWALIQGLIAVATNRGRAFGIAASVVAVAGPVVFTAAGTMTMLAGYATAAAMPVG
ncbi:hypothetical protein [Microbacterium sp. KR10-403]|uniref:hypothetical protein n=1 Tax=Microbacterium sp. KR10-403 TaxID=3158581 RepID=UPI0032E3DDE9